MKIERCYKCGGRIIFKNIDNRTVPIHIDGACNRAGIDKREPSKQYESFVTPNANCPECGAKVFYYENSYGSKVFFDSLGPPWPVHPCTSNNSSISPSDHNEEPFLYSGWVPFKLLSICIRKNLDPPICIIKGDQIQKNQSLYTRFEIKYEDGIRDILNKGICFIKISGSERIKKYHLAVFIGINGQEESFRFKSIDQKEHQVKCPLCREKFQSRHFLEVHLRQRHWDKRTDNFTNSRSLNNTLRHNMNFNTWKEIILRDLN
jgi:DNA-directed RNA polymerase subunit RPC12/RpoP